MSVARSDGVSADWKRERAKMEGVSPQILADQLMKANKRIEVLGAQLVSLKADKLKDDHTQLNVLERVAYALREASHAAVAQQSVPLDPAGHHTPHPNDRAEPGGATKRVRRARTKLENALDDAVRDWDEAKERDFLPVRPGEQGYVPRVRCGKRGCSHYDVPVPAWDRRGRAKEFCTGCSQRLPQPISEGAAK